MTPEPSEANLTKFYILERRDLVNHNPDVGGDNPDACHESLVGWQQIGEKLARDRDQALRLFLGTPVQEIEGVYVAVSENAWKPKAVSIKPAIKIGDAT